jgi:hypothetical protein
VTIPADKGLELRTYSGFGDALAALKENPAARAARAAEGAGWLGGKPGGCAATSAPGPGRCGAGGCRWVNRFNAMLEVLRRPLVIAAVLPGSGCSR